ncbi:MAG: 23S rRNA (cytosine(2499)-C(5))-methyltransferase, partial [Verrucomicrobiota bacterium]
MPPSRLHLRLKPAAESTVRGGHPWVFAGSIREQSRAGEAGELGIIFDRNNKFLAIGLYDPDSPIALRVLHSGKPVQIDENWWRERIRAAIQFRQSIFKPGTNAARLINGESDNFPGLVLDRYNQTYVLKLYTRSWFPWLPQISRLIQHELSPTSLILRLSRN